MSIIKVIVSFELIQNYLSNFENLPNSDPHHATWYPGGFRRCSAKSREKPWISKSYIQTVVLLSMQIESKLGLLNWSVKRRKCTEIDTKTHLWQDFILQLQLSPFKFSHANEDAWHAVIITTHISTEFHLQMLGKERRCSRIRFNSVQSEFFAISQTLCTVILSFSWLTLTVGMDSCQREKSMVRLSLPTEEFVPSTVLSVYWRLDPVEFVNLLI